MITLNIQRYVISDAKRQQAGSIKAKTDLCQGRYWLVRDYHHGLLLVRNLYVQSDLCVYFQSLGW